MHALAGLQRSSLLGCCLSLLETPLVDVVVEDFVEEFWW